MIGEDPSVLVDGSSPITNVSAWARTEVRGVGGHGVLPAKDHDAGRVGSPDLGQRRLGDALLGGQQQRRPVGPGDGRGGP